MPTETLPANQIIKVYSKPSSQPSVSSILEKYRIQWRHEPEPSFIDGIASSFDFLGVFQPKAKLSPLRSRKNSRVREILKFLGNRPKSSR